jgi:hypothetical protein
LGSCSHRPFLTQTGRFAAGAGRVVVQSTSAQSADKNLVRSVISEAASN